MMRTVLSVLIILSLFSGVVGGADEGTSECVFILTPMAWYMGLKDTNISGVVNISLRYRLSNVTLSTSVRKGPWTLVQGFFSNNTSIIRLSNGSKLFNEYVYSGNVSGLIDSLLEDSNVYAVKGIYSRNISLKLNDTLTYKLLNETIDLWTTTRQRTIIVDFRIRATNTSLIALGVSVNATSNNIRYNVTYYADSVHRELFIPVNPREILLNGSSSIDSLDVTVKAYNDFNGVVDVVLYILEFPQPVLDVRINNTKTTCRPYIFLSPTNAPKAIAVAVREYYIEITSPPSEVYGIIREDDELLFDYTYRSTIKIIDQDLLNRSRLNFLYHVFRDLFNSTTIEANWSASIQFKVNNVVGGVVNYVLRVLQLRAKYNPPPLQGASKPICGDGILGVCPVLWLSKLRGADSTISRALAVLPAPGTAAVSSTAWLYLPWGTDIALPGYQATPENLAMRPLLFTRVYLGYPFASLTPLSGAIWFTGRGRVEDTVYGAYRGIPVVGLRFSGENYTGLIYIDTFYLSPVRAFFEGSAGSWRNIGLEHHVYYDLNLFRWKGFWRNLTTSIIPVRIESKNSSVRLLLLVTQPGSGLVEAKATGNAIELNITAGEPVRILILGEGKPYDSRGAYWLALPLISDIDIIYPTTLLYISQKEPSTYNFIAAFPIITVDSPRIRLLVLNGDRWLLENINVGRPFPINNSNINIQSYTSTATPTTNTINTTSTISGNETGINTIDRNMRLIVGLALFAIVAVALFVYKRLYRKH